MGGSYPFVESYNVPLEKHTVVGVITKFKEDNPQFNLPDTIYKRDFLLIGIKDEHKRDPYIRTDKAEIATPVAAEKNY